LELLTGFLIAVINENHKTRFFLFFLLFTWLAASPVKQNKLMPLF